MWKQKVCNLRRFWEVHPKTYTEHFVAAQTKVGEVIFWHVPSKCVSNYKTLSLCTKKNKLPKSRRERGVMIAEGEQLWIVVEVDMLQVTKVLENI